MQRGATAGGTGRSGGAAGAVLALAVSLLPVPAAAQSAGQAAPPRLTPADLPELTLASSDGLRIGRAALPEAAPPLPPARPAPRVAARVLAPADPEVPVLAAVPPAARPADTAQPPAVRAPVRPAALPQAEPPPPLAAVAPDPLPQARTAVQRVAAVPPGRRTAVPPAPLAPRWPDPENPADRAVLEGIFGPVLPPGLLLDIPAPADPKELALAVQTELQRLNCYRGALDGDWGRGSRSALEAYGKAAGAMPDSLDPTPALLQTLQARPDGKLCPDPAKPKPAATAAPSQKQQQPSKPVQKQQPAKPAPKQQPAKPKLDNTIIGL